MPTIDEGTLAELLNDDLSLRLVEPHIYSVGHDLESTNSYDKTFGSFYDRVACSAIYNRIVWGYSISRFASLTRDALASSKDGWVLDAGCGSLAFTAETYASYAERPVILMDQSLKLLRMAKSRLIKMKGDIASHMVFLHADALRLPFRPRAFNTIISLNLLHVLDDLSRLLKGLKSVLTEDGAMIFTSLVKSCRLADRYLAAWEKAGEVKSRDVVQLKAVFDKLGMPARYDTFGSMAFIRCGAIGN